MPILCGAVAYLEEALKEFEAEIASWDLEKPYPHPISCPTGGVCDKSYLLFSEINAANDTVVDQVDTSRQWSMRTALLAADESGLIRRDSW
jgi:hypothetical protein